MLDKGGPGRAPAPVVGKAPGPEPEDEQDKQWILDFQGGSEAGFNRLVLKHKDRIFSLCLRLLQDRHEADDAAQETFVRVFQGLRGFRGEAKFSTWLYRIAVNACKNKLDSKEYRHRKDRRDLEEGEAELMKPVPSPAQVLESKGRRERIEAAIGRLPEDQRMLVVLRDVEGRSYEEIADATGLNPGTLKSRLNRGRRQLQEWLRELW